MVKERKRTTASEKAHASEPAMFRCELVVKLLINAAQTGRVKCYFTSTTNQELCRELGYHHRMPNKCLLGIVPRFNLESMGRRLPNPCGVGLTSSLSFVASLVAQLISIFLKGASMFRSKIFWGSVLGVVTSYLFRG